MNISPNRIVIAAGLAVVGAGAITYALHTSSPAPTARVAPLAPPPPVTQTADPVATPAPAPDAAAVPAPTEAPAAVAQNNSDSANTDATASVAPSEPKTPTSRHAKARLGADTSTDTALAVASTAAPAATATGAADADSVKPADAPAQAPAPAVAAASEAPPAAPGAETANVDSKITTEVKSRLAADSITKDADINVNTTQGVVVLTGTLATQDAVDHVRVVAQNVPDVKSVDTSALKVTST